MMIQLLLRLFAIVFLQITGTYAIADEDHLIPTHYDLAFKFFLPEDSVEEYDNYTFVGVARIIFYPIRDSLAEFDIDTKALNISLVSLKIIKRYGVDQSPIDIKVAWSVTHNNELTIKTKRPLRIHQTLELTIEFAGEIKDALLNNKYNLANSNENNFLAIGPIPPDEPHELFPCFNDPKLKAKFTISAEYHQSYNAWSNSVPLQTSILQNSNRVLKKFKTTPAISPHLVVIMIAKLEEFNVPHKNISVIARKEVMPETKYAVKVARSVLQAFDEYTGIPYSSFDNTEKLNLVFAPIRMFYAAEKWGTLIFDETRVLCNKDNDNDDNKIQIIMTLTEKISNLWFGNLVTCDRWEYSWLNEAFGKYFKYFLDNDVRSISHMEETFNVFEVQYALKFDNKGKSVSLTDPDLTGLRIRDSKGPVIIRQMVHIMGEDNFQKGIRKYLNDNKYDTATPNDLIDALGDFWPHNQIAFRKMFNDFTTQPGYALVTLSLSQDGKSFTAKQRRYYDNEGEDEDPNAKIDKSLKWKIALSYTTNVEMDFEETGPKVFLDENELEVIQLDHEAEWIIGNIRQTGYYRVNYDEGTWYKLIAALKTDHFSHIDKIDRCQLVFNALALLATDLPNKDILFELLEYMKNEDSMICWLNLGLGLKEIKKYLDDKYDLSDKYIGGLIKNIYNKVGFKQENAGYHDILARNVIRSLACSVELEECVSDAQKEFDAFVETGNPLDSEIRFTVLCTLLKHNDEKYFDIVFNLFISKAGTSTDVSPIIALGCAKDETLLWKLLDYIFEKAAKASRYYLFSNIATSGGANAILSYMKNNFNKITESLEKSDIKRILERIEHWCTTRDRFQKLEDIIEDNKDYFEGISGLEYSQIRDKIIKKLEYNGIFVDAYKNYLDTKANLSLNSNNFL